MEYAEIMANKLQQLEEDDSSNESTATEDAENEGLNNQTTGQQERQKDSTTTKAENVLLKEGRPKYKGKVNNSIERDMSDPPARLINACVCGRPF